MDTILQIFNYEARRFYHKTGADVIEVVIEVVKTTYRNKKFLLELGTGESH